MVTASPAVVTTTAAVAVVVISAAAAAAAAAVAAALVPVVVPSAAAAATAAVAVVMVSTAAVSTAAAATAAAAAAAEPVDGPAVSVLEGEVAVDLRERRGLELFSLCLASLLTRSSCRAMSPSIPSSGQQAHTVPSRAPWPNSNFSRTENTEPQSPARRCTSTSSAQAAIVVEPNDLVSIDLGMIVVPGQPPSTYHAATSCVCQLSACRDTSLMCQLSAGRATRASTASNRIYASGPRSTCLSRAALLAVRSSRA